MCFLLLLIFESKGGSEQCLTVLHNTKDISECPIKNKINPGISVRVMKILPGMPPKKYKD